ncbi:kinase [Bacillus phage vB_BanS_Nate]|uniref:Serine/threonine protein kinase n=1 Tax=Bacillus phage vB_BanS_Nate TaxID=2894788 RepID=A0AAE9CDK8_9CAUD|nr:kinase [Bacillus phage vB_BanS_Nate]UGO50865.1 serine/threonine protein kinase [Bacillus phage vB_BanS_Nate]
MNQLLIENQYHPFDYRIMNHEVKMFNMDVDLDDMEHIVKMVKIGDRMLGQGLKQFERLGHGFFGTVYGYKGYAIKYYAHGKSKDSNDIAMLGRLQHLKCVPRLYGAIGDKAIIISRVNGYTVQDYMRHVDNRRIPNIVSRAFNREYEKALQEIMRAGIQPTDLHSENVMIDKVTGLPVIVDCGEFYTTTHSETSIQNLSSATYRNTYDEVIRPMEKYINDTYKQEAKEYKAMLLERVEAMGGLANMDDIYEPPQNSFQRFKELLG